MDKELHYLNMILSNDATEEFKINFSSSKNRVFSEIKAFENYCSTEDLFKYGVTDYSVTDRLLGYYNDLFTFGGSILTFNNIISNTKKLDKVLNTVNFNRCNFYISGLTGYQSGLLLKYILGQETKNYLSAREMALKNDDIDFSTYGSAIVILDYLYRQTDKLEYLKDIKFLGEKYLENIGKHKLTGMLHGYAGDLIVLNVLFHYY
ncbi:lantibiotic modifying enzyme, partial [Lactococcus piscium]|nr:lantibiotic modifying enzyme [Lactococcus carnosus]